jgi:catechol 2,3-dioxygenase-like lactoylglutathione lyase family enzyme
MLEEAKMTTPKFVCNHLHFRSEDPEAAAQFYCDNFGASIKSVTPFSNTKAVKRELKRQPKKTISGRAEGEDPVPGSTEPRYGLDHFGFEVDDMEAAAAKMKANSVHFICEPWTMPSGTTVAFIEAPDHVSVEIIKRP